MDFKSKYGIDDLVEFDEELKDGALSVGIIKQVKFRKTDSVNYIAEYNIEKVNGGASVFDVHDREIKGLFRRHG